MGNYFLNLFPTLCVVYTYCISRWNKVTLVENLFLNAKLKFNH